jgi:ATP-binding cassette subfamily B protein
MRPGPRTTASGSSPTLHDDATGREPELRAVADEQADPLEAPVPKGAAGRLLRSALGSDKRRLWLAIAAVLLQQAAALAGPVLVAVTIDWAIPALRDRNAVPLIIVVSGYACCMVFAGRLQSVFVRLSVEVGQMVLNELRVRVFAHIQAQSAEFHGTHSTGALASRATGDIEAVRELFESGIDQIVTAAVSLVYVSSVLLVLDWQLGVAALGAMLPVYWTMRVFRKRSLPVYRQRSDAAAAVAGDMSETFAGIRTVQAFRRERANDQRFALLNRRLGEENRRAGMEMARYVTYSRLVANIAIAGLVLWGGFRVASGTLALGSFAGAVLYLRDLYDSPLQLGGVLDSYQSATASLQKIAGLLAIEPGVAEPARPATLPRLAADRVGRRVRYDDVAFAYRGSGEVLSGFSLDIPAGQTVALVGPSGGGKSTLAKLLARFHDPTSGRVLLDGVDLRCVSTADLRRSVVMVPQENFLFSGTVAENIALARPDATAEEIRHAAAAIGADAFIAALCDGYNTDVGGGGSRFSAGQRQLIALARVFLVNPSVIVLDEATSAIDIPSERAVQDAMRTVLRGRTALVIAHRLSTIEIADRVLVLVDGRVVEDCTPAEFVGGQGRSAAAGQLWLGSNR